MRSYKPSWFSSVLAVLGVLLLVCSAAYAFPPGRAATVWSDDFSDGDYTDWTVEEGTYTAVNYRLEDTGGIENVLRHASTVTTGTWRFDLDGRSPLTGDTEGSVYFMASNLDPSLHLGDSYGIGIWHGSIFLGKIVDLTYTQMGNYYIGPNVLAVHIDVTRNTTGDLHVWVNGTHRISCQDTTVTSSTDFIFESSGPVPHWLDNVVVSNTIDLEPPTTTTNTTTTTTPIPGFAIPAITLGLVIALATAIMYRRRRP